jgi:hypothetical protein
MGRFRYPPRYPKHKIRLKKTLSGGAPERIRTPNLQIRSLMLYPVELRAHRGSPGQLVAEARRRGKAAPATGR